jgi:uncharacterized membrane protein
MDMSVQTMDHLDDLRLADGMTSTLVRTLTITTAIGAGIAGGVFFAFSTFVMRGLDDLPPGQAIAAMQTINREAPNPVFMLVLFGTAVLAIGLAILALVRWGQPGSVWLLVGAAVYLVGIVLTAAYHVPRNDALDLVDPNAAGAIDTWHTYLVGWNLLNHVRTLSGIGAAVAFTLAL